MSIVVFQQPALPCRIRPQPNSDTASQSQRRYQFRAFQLGDYDIDAAEAGEGAESSFFLRRNLKDVT